MCQGDGVPDTLRRGIGSHLLHLHPLSTCIDEGIGGGDVSGTPSP